MKMRSGLTGFIVSIFWCFILAGCGAEYSDESDLQFWFRPKPYVWHKNLTIPSFDGVKIKAQLKVPNPEVFPGPRPAVIFVNSWTLNHYEYTAQALRLANKGYIVLSYATRGFGGSGGMVSAASPNDIRDASFMIDWLQEKTQLDITRVGMSGVSYGGGISLLTLAHDERVATVVAMSGWADLEQALYGDETIRRVWIDILVGSGAVFGNLDPEFNEIYQGVRSQQNVEAFQEWAQERSSIHLVDRINERRAPVFLANNYDDQLFPPNQMHRFYEKLTVPKKFVMNNGIHASAEIGGILGLPSRIWDDTIRWFDYWFYDSPNGILQEKPIALENSGKLEFFDKLPDNRKIQSFPIEPMNSLKRAGGQLPQDVRHLLEVNGRWDSGATSGIPIISSIVDAHTPFSIRKNINFINQSHAAIYRSPFLGRSISLRGIPRVEAWVRPHAQQAQLVAYLYDVDLLGGGVLLSHGIKTLRNVKPGVPVFVDFELNALAADIRKGRRLAIVIDAFDPLYDSLPATARSFDLLHGSTSQTKLFLPVF